MSRDTRNDFALSIQRLRADRYISRQYGDDLRTIESAHERTCKDYLQVEAGNEPNWRAILLRYGRHEADCSCCHDSMHKSRPVCICGFDDALAATLPACE